MKIKPFLKPLMWIIFGALLMLGILKIVHSIDNHFSNVSSCDDSKRYMPSDNGEGAIAIDEATMTTLTNRYVAQIKPLIPIIPSIPGDTGINGVFISKQVFDRIFSNSEYANGVMCYMGWDPQKGIQMIVKPSVQSTVNVNGPPNMYNFLIKSYCPPDCDDVRIVRMGETAL